LAQLKVAVCHTLFLELMCLLKGCVRAGQPSCSWSLWLSPVLGCFWAALQEEGSLRCVLVSRVFSCYLIRRLNSYANPLKAVHDEGRWSSSVVNYPRSVRVVWMQHTKCSARLSQASWIICFS